MIDQDALAKLKADADAQLLLCELLLQQQKCIEAAEFAIKYQLNGDKGYVLAREIYIALNLSITDSLLQDFNSTAAREDRQKKSKLVEEINDLLFKIHRNLRVNVEEPKPAA